MGGGLGESQRLRAHANSELISVWLDDLREAPPGWRHCVSVTEVIELLETRRVKVLSLDHDLGLDATGREASGYDLCLWMAEHDCWPEERVLIHSMNPVGVARMRGVVERYGPYSPSASGREFKRKRKI